MLLSLRFTIISWDVLFGKCIWFLFLATTFSFRHKQFFCSVFFFLGINLKPLLVSVVLAREPRFDCIHRELFHFGFLNKTTHYVAIYSTQDADKWNARRIITVTSKIITAFKAEQIIKEKETKHTHTPHDSLMKRK